MPIPSVLKPFLKDAESLIKDNEVKQIEFSASTYQVHVLDKNYKDGVWAFIQLTDRLRVKDSFCSCEDGDAGACVHLAAAILAIYNGHKKPLHKRFEKSLCNKLFFSLSEQISDTDLKNLKLSKKGQYFLHSPANELLFSIKVRHKNAISHLNDIIFNRFQETEETSLKFSNLPQDEIDLWKEGRPSNTLRYELSFLSDVAKWFMLLQESNQNYTIDFTYSKDQIPEMIHIHFDDLECSFTLKDHIFSEMIPALKTVRSPLAVHSLKANHINKITYDTVTKSFVIDTKEISSSELDQNKGILLGSWFYIPNDGFYPLDPLGLLSSKIIYTKDIEDVLNHHLNFIKNHLVGTTIHDEPLDAQYQLYFDKNWDLHIDCYALSVGDLNAANSYVFGEWIYLDSHGFYKLKNQIYNEIKHVIKKDLVPEFIQANRTWLNVHRGFETHLSSIESLLSYTMESLQGPLFFERSLLTKDSSTQDFGSWIYVKNLGFYSKLTNYTGLNLKLNTYIHADQIPHFIRTKRDELNLVQHFFTKIMPISSVSLILKKDEDDQIIVEPVYEIIDDYKDRQISFFDEFVYIKDEGFSELPAELRLPINYRHQVIIEKKDINQFFDSDIKAIRPFLTFSSAEFEKPYCLKLVCHSLSKSKETSAGWYDIELDYQSEYGLVPISTLVKNLKKNRYCFTLAGLIDLQDKQFDWLKLISKKRLQTSKNILTLSTIELIRLNAITPIEILDGKNSALSKQLLSELTSFEIPQDPNIDGLACSLRPYQTIGLNWLWFLYTHGLSGLLCDDMGLGKTHQTMALIAAIRNFFKDKQLNAKKHFLIICPTSVMYHWQDKLSKFLPKCKVCTFYGLDRSLSDFEEDYDILLTSYGVWRIENKALSKIPFELAIFDEIQIAKNHNSRLHASLSKANAQIRIGLTGTPIENRLRELKALFDLVLPTYMPSEKDFRELFVKPIEKQRDPAKKQTLSRLIHPFVLRRKKEDVLTDLPEKTEEIAHCSLSEEQVYLYNSVVDPSRQAILKDLQMGEKPISYVHIFSVLSALKQICDHPACYKKDPASYKDFQSGKWDLFVELLEEAFESGQKVVVFSQYLNMLDIIQNYLDEHRIKFASIRGSTINRGQELVRFNSDPECKVFVGSLQASGLGLELTSASVVIHYDRWWNAARENQATDRVHRIGQKRGVQVFKLVTLGTFEEKIDAMINRKGKLMEDVVGVDDHRFLKLFNREEIIELLQKVSLPNS